ncbi:Dipeptidyl peptidase 4, partial [Smittium culicis]
MESYKLSVNNTNTALGEKNENFHNDSRTVRTEPLESTLNSRLGDKKFSLLLWKQAANHLHKKANSNEKHPNIFSRYTSIFGKRDNTPKDETNAEEQYISFNEYNAGSYVSNLDDITYVKHPENATIDGLYISEEDDIKIVNIEETFEHILATKSDISSALVAASLGNDTSFISITASPDWKFLLLETDRVKIFRHSYYSTYYVYSVDTKKMTPLSNTLNDRVTLAQFSPVGHSISFVIENDLYTSDMSKINRVTTSGGVNVFNAISDWVYEEEVFGSSYAHWWSPDGTKILFLQTNDTFVTEYKYSLYNPNSANNSYPEEQSIKFPKAGYSNPTPQVFVHDLSSAG